MNHDEPRPEPATPECPPELSPLARKEWDRLVGELGSLRMLTNLDRAALAAYCGAYALWAEAMEAIQKYGAMIKSPQGFPIQSPYLAIANRQAEIMMRIASECSCLENLLPSAHPHWLLEGLVYECRSKDEGHNDVRPRGRRRNVCGARSHDPTTIPAGDKARGSPKATSNIECMLFGR